jgi:hypothetical protein
MKFGHNIGMKPVWLLLAIPLVIAACSKQQVYQSLQYRNEAECYSLPVAQQQDCLEQVKGPDYEEYQQELEKAGQ